VNPLAQLKYSRGTFEFLDQNLREIGQGVHNLQSEISKNTQTEILKKYYSLGTKRSQGY